MSVGRLPTPSHPPGGPQSLLAGGRASEAFRRPPTGQEGHLPPREVSLPPGGQNPITLEYQIYTPTKDTLVTGMRLGRIGKKHHCYGSECFRCRALRISKVEVEKSGLSRKNIHVQSYRLPLSDTRLS